MPVRPQDTPFPLSLTGPDSHVLEIEAGQGSFAMGPKGMRGVRKLDAVVDPDAAIDWSAFDALTVPAGYPWPRFFYYQGRDTGFAAWSRRRPIEDFNWRPVGSAMLDLAGARIGTLEISLGDADLKLSLDGRPEVGTLGIDGDPDRLKVTGAGQEVPDLLFRLARRGSAKTLALPPQGGLAKARSVTVDVDPMGPAFDCASLLQFERLESLSLSGALANLERLSGLTRLQTLSIRFCPVLTGLPALAEFPNLTGFIAANIDKASGPALKRQVDALAASGRLTEYANVTALRDAAWFATEYGAPFAWWPEKTGKKASKAYKTAATAVGKARSAAEVRAAIEAFVAAINGLPNIETGEREDVGVAVERLAGLSSGMVPPDQAQAWLDATRDF